MKIRNKNMREVTDY